MLVPTPYSAQFRGRAAAKERGKHASEAFSQAFLLAAQASFDLLDEGVGERSLLAGLCEGLGSPLDLGLVTLKALMGCLAAALGGLSLALLLGFGPGHDASLLREVVERDVRARHNL